MKKLFRVASLLFAITRLTAQDTGPGVQMLSYFPSYERTSVPHTAKQLTGIRFEWSSINKGFYGVHFNYFFPVTDSAEVWMTDNYGSLYVKKGKERKTTFDAGFRFGVGIPQDFNEFLRIYLGGGLAYTRTKVETLSPGGNIYPSRIHFYPGCSTELLAGIAWEFERLYLFAQYSYMYTISELTDMPHRNGVSAGVLIPLIRH
jgi:hypothetical protein